MAQRSPLLLIVLSVGLVASYGCGPHTDPPDEDREEPGIYAAAMCEAADRCGCYVPFESLSDCETTFKDRLAALLELDLAFDEECFDSMIESSAFEACSHFEQIEEPCVVFQGNRPRGASCTEWRNHIPPFFVQECDQGLICQFGTCLEPEDDLAPVVEGAACSLYNGSICPSEGAYDHLYCGADNLCHATVGPGDECTSFDACEANQVPGVYCAGLGETGTGICTSRGALGDPCSPADSSPCEMPTGSLGWCDPDEHVCVDGGPAICNYAALPHRFEPAQP